MSETLRCGHCKQVKPIEEFTPSGSLVNRCRACTNEVNANYRKSHPKPKKPRAPKTYVPKKIKPQKPPKPQRVPKPKKPKPTCKRCGKPLELYKHKYCVDCSKLIMQSRGRSTSCCITLKRHHDMLKDDDQRLTTEFIKSIAKCDCEVEE